MLKVLHLFSSDASKTCYVLGLLRGRALAWAEATSSHEDFCSLPFAVFKGKLSIVLDYPNYGGNAAAHLLKLKQGTRSVADYTVEFWTLAADANWDDAAVRAVCTGHIHRL